MNFEAASIDKTTTFTREDIYGITSSSKEAEKALNLELVQHAQQLATSVNGEDCVTCVVKSPSETHSIICLSGVQDPTNVKQSFTRRFPGCVFERKQNPFNPELNDLWVLAPIEARNCNRYLTWRQKIHCLVLLLIVILCAVTKDTSIFLRKFL